MDKRLFRSLILWLLILPVSTVAATEIEISGAWARALPPVVKIGAAYLEIQNAGTQADELIGASSTISESVEIHEHTMVSGMMQMRELESVPLSAGDNVVFQPGGKHFMLIRLRRALKAGEQFQMKLEFKRAGVMSFNVPVESR